MVALASQQNETVGKKKKTGAIAGRQVCGDKRWRETEKQCINY